MLLTTSMLLQGTLDSLLPRPSHCNLGILTSLEFLRASWVQCMDPRRIMAQAYKGEGQTGGAISAAHSSPGQSCGGPSSHGLELLRSRCWPLAHSATTALVGLLGEGEVRHVY